MEADLHFDPSRLISGLADIGLNLGLLRTRGMEPEDAAAALDAEEMAGTLREIADLPETTQ